MRKGKVDILVYCISGEFFLNKRPNGGTVVFLRSIFVTALLLIVVLPIKVFCAKNAVPACSPSQFKVEIGEMLPWAGAIFAAAYAAFYSRFSAQWAYLAALYNQIMATSVALAPMNTDAASRMAVWRAAFIEDAIDLHLARKSMFRSVIIEYLSTDQAVVDAFFEGTDRAAEKAEELEKAWRFSVLPPSPKGP